MSQVKSKILTDYMPLCDSIQSANTDSGASQIPGYKGILYEVTGHDCYGNNILKKVGENTVVVGGAIASLEKLCGVAANWKPKTLHCEYCGKEFVQNSNQQRFCSNLCANRKRNGYQDIKNTKVKCAFCGKEFIKTSPNKKYCCQQCMVRSNHKYIGETIGICAICGKEFIRKTTIKKYCSKECSKIAHRQHAKNT